MGIASGLMNGTPVGRQKNSFFVPVLLITGYQDREAVQDGSIEPLYHAVRLRMQSYYPGFVYGAYFTQSLANCRIKVSPLIGVQLQRDPKFVRSSVELEPLQQLKLLRRE
ncbi:hypothetical protein TNCV_4664761 [Trichonephila clavipes]|uniref:Uncharacterized protein n=1 Tax=Trichonephila clavipes TaxID=2585209 RepID=A0A8X6RSI7_TRICX|nr:hypothetical protein TNCV_4664761 [Trichonephila clavipes]